MPISVSQLRADRDTAGAAYAAAAAAYVAAANELTAYDQAVSNTNAGGLRPIGTFSNPVQVSDHPAYLSRTTAASLASSNVQGPIIAARTAVLVASVTG